VSDQEIRLQKLIADAGITSRRKAESLIVEGRVKVNGKIVRTLGSKINPEKDKVEVDGSPLSSKMTKLYIAFYKPRGVLSTMSDPAGRPSLGDIFKDSTTRLFHVGRLDKESEGLIILTNDGIWANRLIHPSNGVLKRYEVLLDEELSPSDLRRLEKGIRLPDGAVRVDRIVKRGPWVEMDIHEGRNQIIRRVFDSLGYEVIALKRTRIGSIHLGELPPGRWRNLSSVELINR
jgi:23S rRNA pseudouridine2605 synthase